jgi:hypothetical protein
MADIPGRKYMYSAEPHHAPPKPSAVQVALSFTQCSCLILWRLHVHENHSKEQEQLLSEALDFVTTFAPIDPSL